MGAKTCMVCSKAESKYKCPVCFIPYCSLGCFKKHKATPCANAKLVLSDEVPKASCAISAVGDEKPSTEQRSLVTPPMFVDVNPTDTPNFHAERPLNVDESCEVLDKAHLESIAASSEIRDALKNEDLQKLIHRIDSSPDPMEELEKAMGVDAFRIFSDKVLSAANP